MDNQSAIDLVKTHGFKPKTKHIDVRRHFIEERIESRGIQLEPISDSDQVADSLTKSV